MAAGSLDAFQRQSDLTEAILSTHHCEKLALDLLDYGCGWRGAQRVIFEGTKRNIDRLSLFDPFCAIHPPKEPQERIVTTEEIFADNRIAFDIIALSYVLCCTTPEEGRRILSALREHQPQAQLLIVDYTLHHRSQMEVLNLLTAQEELKWRERMGDAEFSSTRRRFTVESFEEFVRSAGYPILGHAALLDSFGVHAAVVTLPQHSSVITPAATHHSTNVAAEPQILQST